MLEATEALNSICNDDSPNPTAAPPEGNIAQPNPRAFDHAPAYSFDHTPAYSFPDSLARLSQQSSQQHERGSAPEAPPPPRPLGSETTHHGTARQGEARPGMWWAGL